MSSLRPANPALARKVWDSMARPSSRAVARRLRHAGMPVSHQTINRWRHSEWRSIEGSEHPLEIARRLLDDVAPLLTGDPLSNAEALVQKSPERDELS
jgi:hypothetical protein